jgi:chemotaxis protein methyltransferase CheR
VVHPSAEAPASDQLLSAAGGIDLRSFREQHVRECVRRALVREGVDDELALAHRLSADEAARRRFRRMVAVSVTRLFRDPEQFALVERLVLPELRDRRLRVWSAGCSNGAELYSLGMTLERLGLLDGATLLGSDLLPENIVAAWAGDYVVGDLRDRLRKRLRWDVRDLVADGAPAGGWGLVMCRNVAIYLAPHAKAALQETLAASLAPGGFLVLGRSESIIDPARLELARVANHTYRRAA